MRNRHNFAGRFHLCAERALCVYKLIEREFRHFYDNVIEYRLKARGSLFRNRVRNFVERVTDRN